MTTFSNDFVNSYFNTLDTFRARIAELQRQMDEAVEEVVKAEEARLTSDIQSPVAVGTRVWCPSHKRYGTVTEVTMTIGTDNGDYYNPDYGSPTATLVFTVQPDPSPARKQVAEPFQTSGLWSEKGVELFNPWEDGQTVKLTDEQAKAHQAY